MSRLMRRAYGYGGTGVERILVSAPCAEYAPEPRWLRLVLLAVLLAVPALVSRFALPKASLQQTVIDMSRLQVKPVPVPETLIIPKPRPVPAVEGRILPQVKPETPPAPVVARIHETPSIASPAAPVPVITRPTLTRELPPAQPRIARERSRTDFDRVAPVETRIRREANTAGESAARTTITRTRDAAAADVPIGRERVAPLRRAAVPVEGTDGAVATLRPLTHKGRAMTPSGTTEGLATRVAARAQISPVTGSGNAGSAAAVGVERGVSLMSLDVCPSHQEEEDAISRVLGVVGSRQSCVNSLGEFRFKGTKRISSFNLMIYPANGRRPSNRCEELEHAYKCLKTR
jgi:hypothetical protein